MGNLCDMHNVRVGQLVVEKRAGINNSGEAKWLCRCDCGNTRIVVGKLLRKGAISCCFHCCIENFAGRKIGQLTVIKRIEDKINCDGHPVIQWECQCECGLKVIRVSTHLRRGNCCCVECKKKIDKIKSFQGYEDISGILWNSIHRGARNRGIEFTITKEYAWNLFLKQNKKCAISGCDLVFAKNKRGQIEGKTTASLDRIDSSKGYIENNVQWVHKWINVMKSDFTQDEFLEICERITCYQKEKALNENTKPI